MSKSTTSYHHGDLHNALIQAGLSVLETDGEAALTLRKVARVAGVSHAAPYRHFADKNALLSVIAQQGFSKLTEAMQAVHTQYADSPVQLLPEIGSCYIRFGIENAAYFQLMFGGLLRANHEDEALRAAGEATFAEVVRAITISQKIGLVRDGDAVELATTAWAMAHGIAALLLEDMLAVHQQGDGELLARQALQNLMLGLRA